MNERDITGEAAAAWVLHEKGATVREIADHLGVSVGTAHSRIRLAADARTVTADLADRTAARVREAATLAELDARLATYMETVEDPNPTARTRLLVSAARRKLLGLDAPTRVAISDDRTPAEPDPVVADAIERAMAENATERDAINRRPRGAGGAANQADDAPPDDTNTE